MSARMFRSTEPAPPAAGRRPLARVVGGLAAVTALSATLVVASTGTASAAAESVSGVSLAWGLSGEQGGGAFFGGCNFLSAGTAGNTGSSRLWTEADGFYKPTAGNVTVEKPDAGGTYSSPSWSTKCQSPTGTPVNPGSPTSLTGNRVVFGAGTGTVNRAAGSARIAWTGSFTSAFYGGLTYWSAANPILSVTGGTGTLTATLSGYGADMNDSSKWVRIPARKVTLATFSGVSLTDTGFSATPNYLGVAITTPAGKTAQAAATSANAAYWGAFPQAFVDFQQLTGTASYWFTSGGSRDAAKPTTAVSVAWELPAKIAPTVTSQPAAVTVAAGQQATFEVGVAGSPTPTVAWQVRTPGTTAWSAVPGATGTTYTVTATPALDRNAYRAVLSNGVGAKVASKLAQLRVVNPT